jgi:hypothetical protein
MRGDQSVRQWRTIRAMEASPGLLTQLHVQALPQYPAKKAPKQDQDLMLKLA